MTHFPLTTKENTPDNIAEDMSDFMLKKIAVSVGWNIDEVNGFIDFQGMYGLRPLDFSVDYHDKLQDIQKQVHDFCKEWLK